jgi:hypothetical protein
MDFDGKDSIMQKVSQMGTMYQKLVQYMQLALALAKVADPKSVEMIAQDIMQTMGGGAAPAAGGSIKIAQGDHIDGLVKKEHGIVENARNRSNAASQPEGGNVVAKEEKK